MSMSELYRKRQSSLSGCVSSRASAVLSPLGLWKPKQRVRYHNEMPGDVQNKNQTAQNNDYFYKTVDIRPISASIPTIVATPSYNQSTQSKRLARTPCDQCGYHNVPIMAHPISPLVRSQTNLELVSTGNARQALLPAIEFPNHGNGSGGGEKNEKNEKTEKQTHGPPPASSNSTSIQTLQISRRPSLLLQDILARRPSALFRGKKEANGHASKSPFGRSLADTAATSMVTINTHGDGDDRHFAAKQSKVKNRRKGNDALSAALSAFYCKILVLVGVCLPITEVISHQIPNYVYQGFYVYLYMGSILFVAFLYATTLRNRTLFNALKNFHEETQNIHLKHKVTHFGSFYLRVGAIAFAIGTMVYSGLEFGQYFELNGKPGCGDVFIAITPICRMILAIVQIQFIFLNTTYLDMARHKVICRFGLMHMVATNLCEWLYVLVEETKHEIFHIGHHDNEGTEPLFTTDAHGSADWSDDKATLTHTQHVTDSMNNTIATTIQNVLANVTIASAGNATAQVTVGCTRTNIMGALVQEVAPFLFPCTIEYSLICAVILYEMWKTVRSITDIDRSRKSSIKPAHHKPANHFSVDCSQSHKGLFFGIIMIVMTIISMIMYFVLYTQPGYERIARQEVTIWEIITYFICTVAIIAGLILIRDLKYVQNSSDDHHSMELDNQLLIVAQTGVYLYGMFSILGSYFSKWDSVPDRIEGIVAEVLGLAETSLQTMFILHASHRRCKGSKQARRKPGREIVTFLLIVNIAIWFINTLIKGRAVFRETNLVFFGVWGWTIITHISMPLAIFYRFHSTICLFEVWKITYKAKTH